jgi:hypothetical protein
MKLYTFFNDYEGKVVYGTTVGGKAVFFFKGFASAEDAKQTTFEWHYNYRLSQLKPNSQGISRPTGMIKEEIEMTLSGEWSEIE